MGKYRSLQRVPLPGSGHSSRSLLLPKIGTRICSGNPSSSGSSGNQALPVSPSAERQNRCKLLGEISSWIGSQITWRLHGNRGDATETPRRRKKAGTLCFFLCGNTALFPTHKLLDRYFWAIKKEIDPASDTWYNPPTQKPTHHVEGVSNEER